MHTDRHLVITGVTGYIGGRLLAAAREKGWWVTILSRRPPEWMGKTSRVRWFYWALDNVPPDAAFRASADFSSVDGIIHLAHAWQTDGSEREINLNGSRRLLEAARVNGVDRIIFGSSISARRDALNSYGRLKWETERLLNGAEHVSARIGLVYGGPRLGQWGTLFRLVRTLPVLPMVAADRAVQPIHVDDLSQALLRLVEIEKPERKIYGLADPDPVEFGIFLKMLAANVFGKSLFILPVPLGLVLAALSVMIRLRWAPAGSDERVLGLAGLPTIECRRDLAELDIKLRPLIQGLAGESRRRRIALEGRVLLEYLTARRPPLGSLRRYVRGVERFHASMPLVLPALARLWPALLCIWEPLGPAARKGNDLAVRLHLALTLADAMMLGHDGAYDYVGDGPARAVAGFLWRCVIEAILLPLRAVFGRR